MVVVQKSADYRQFWPFLRVVVQEFTDYHHLQNNNWFLFKKQLVYW